eukprot:TRINITY_DN4857_c0_g1_i1.p1 TRINITY_DN4857_c0_g1~~TRINITY_DN4857_c0_g1_i1.p1  ORF type:complete len:472 (+),score=50.18 TRINITY_DN4857_c0_g1_i1:61-1476(+)
MDRASHAEQNRSLKTKRCSFHMVGRCLRGTSCTFAHDENELRPQQDDRRRDVSSSYVRAPLPAKSTAGAEDERAHGRRSANTLPSRGCETSASNQWQVASADDRFLTDSQGWPIRVLNAWSPNTGGVIAAILLPPPCSQGQFQSFMINSPTMPDANVPASSNSPRRCDDLSGTLPMTPAAKVASRGSGTVPCGLRRTPAAKARDSRFQAQRCSDVPDGIRGMAAPKTQDDHFASRRSDVVPNGLQKQAAAKAQDASDFGERLGEARFANFAAQRSDFVSDRSRRAATAQAQQGSFFERRTGDVCDILPHWRANCANGTMHGRDDAHVGMPKSTRGTVFGDADSSGSGLRTHSRDSCSASSGANTSVAFGDDAQTFLARVLPSGARTPSSRGCSPVRAAWSGGVQPCRTSRARNMHPNGAWIGEMDGGAWNRHASSYGDAVPVYAPCDDTANYVFPSSPSSAKANQGWNYSR